MVTASLILQILAFLCLALAAAGIQSNRVNLMPLGLAIWLLAIILGSAGVK